MNQKYFTEIKAREQAAAPGPWHIEKIYHDEPGYEEFIKSARISTEPDEDHSAYTIMINNWSNPAMNDLEFIAHARTDISALIEQHEQDEKLFKSYKKSNLEQVKGKYRLEKENAMLKKKVEQLRGYMHDFGDKCVRLSEQQAQEQEAKNERSFTVGCCKKS